MAKSLKEMVASGEALIDDGAPAGPAKPVSFGLRALIDSGEATTEAPPRVGAGETFVNSGVNAIPLAGPITNATSAGIVSALRPGPGAKLTPQAATELEDMGVEQEEAPGFLDTYRDIRDTRALRSEAGSEQNPWASRAGTGVGLAASIFAPASGVGRIAQPLGVARAAKGAGAASRLLAAGKTGTAYGTLNALTNGKADLTSGEFGQATRDVAGIDQIEAGRQNIEAGKYGAALLNFLGAGAPGGALSGLAAGGAAEAVAPIAEKALNKIATSQGRRVLTNKTGNLSDKLEVGDEAVLEAIDSGALRPFSSTQGTLERLKDQVGGQVEKYNQLIRELESRGVRGPEAQRVAQRMLDRATEVSENVTDDVLPNMYLRTGARIEKMAGPDGRLRLSQGEELKRYLQDKAKGDYGKSRSTMPGATRKEIAAIVRESNEGAVAEAGKAAGEGSEIQGLAEQFAPVKTRLGKLIEAKNAAKGGAARVAQRPSGYMPGAIDTMAAVGTGQPSLLLMKPLLAFLRNNQTSTVAAYSRRLADAMRPGVAQPQAARLAELFKGSLLDD